MKKSCPNFKFCPRKANRDKRFDCHVAAADKNAINYCYFIAKIQYIRPAT